MNTCWKRRWFALGQFDWENSSPSSPWMKKGQSYQVYHDYIYIYYIQLKEPVPTAKFLCTKMPPKKWKRTIGWWGWLWQGKLTIPGRTRALCIYWLLIPRWSHVRGSSILVKSSFWSLKILLLMELWSQRIWLASHISRLCVDWIWSICGIRKHIKENKGILLRRYRSVRLWYSHRNQSQWSIFLWWAIVITTQQVYFRIDCRWRRWTISCSRCRKK